MSSAILVLSGPSGAGKSTIIQEASKDIGEFYFSVSTTTREPREGEIDGVDYHFVTRDEFEEGIKAGEFLEFATVHGNYYGTSLRPVKEALEAGKLVIFDIDVQGHRLVKANLGDIVVSAFITPPSLSELERRLKDRGNDNSDVIKQRIQNAKDEIKAIDEYDFVILNDKVEDATKAFIAIANAARFKMSKKESSDFVDRWLKQ